MKTGTNKNTEKGVAWLKALFEMCPSGDYDQLRGEIETRCNWNNRGTWRNKLNGLTPITVAEMVVIKEISKKHNIRIDFTDRCTCTIAFIKPITRTLQLVS